MKYRPNLPVASLAVAAARFSFRRRTGYRTRVLGAPSCDFIDAWDRTLELSRWREARPGRLRGQGFADQNQAFKDDLAALARGDRYRDSSTRRRRRRRGIRLLARARFREGRHRGQSHRFGTVIYCDWDGVTRRALGVRRGRAASSSTERTEGPLSHEGAISQTERREAVELLRARSARRRRRRAASGRRG